MIKCSKLRHLVNEERVKISVTGRLHLLDGSTVPPHGGLLASLQTRRAGFELFVGTLLLNDFGSSENLWNPQTGPQIRSICGSVCGFADSTKNADPRVPGWRSQSANLANLWNVDSRVEMPLVSWSYPTCEDHFALTTDGRKIIVME